MNTYTFVPATTNSLRIVIQADSEINAWRLLQIKFNDLEKMGVEMPRMAVWSIQ